MAMTLRGKCALITGSSRGIGRGIALKLAENGAKVAVHYYRNEAAAEDTLAQVQKRESSGFVVQGDVLQPKDISRIFERVRSEFGRLDILSATPDRRSPLFSNRRWISPWSNGIRPWIPRRKLSCWGAGGCPPHVRERQDPRDHLRHRQPYGWPATVGWNGIRKGCDGMPGSLFWGSSSQTGHHRQRDQSGMDRRQCVKHTPNSSAGPPAKLAQARMDANGPVRHPRRYRKCRGTPLRRRSCLDHGPGHLRGWRRFVIERRSPARNPIWIGQFSARGFDKPPIITPFTRPVW